MAQIKKLRKVLADVCYECVHEYLYTYTVFAGRKNKALRKDTAVE